MNKKLISVSVATSVLMALPLVSFAVALIPAPGLPRDLNIGYLIDNIFSFIWPIIGAIVVLFLILAALEFITSRGEPGKVAKARQFLIWAIIGTVVLLLAFSIPFVIKNVLRV